MKYSVAVLTSLLHLAASQIDLTNWILELPVKADPLNPNNTEVATILNPQLNAVPRFSNEFFYTTPASDGQVFHTPVFPPNGQPQSGTPFVSTFLRESDPNSTFVHWDSTKGTHSLKADLAVTTFPGTTNAKMIVAEIKVNSNICVGCTSFALFAHAKSNPITYYLKGVFGNFTTTVDIDPAYQLGAKFNIEILVVEGVIYFYYNNELKSPEGGFKSTEQSVYYKAGAFSQNQNSVLHPAAAVNEVVFYSLAVTHNESTTPPQLPPPATTSVVSSEPTASATADAGKGAASPSTTAAATKSSSVVLSLFLAAVGFALM
ncbi:hypothetical protein HK099_007719 [Clydaea vesicula]|uniref:Alginate lyase 2 domain-containing protein n=1 Tax=Clydaea vesicula TaxID=447962 RepID=A0AAD5TWM2_9FUNG|nr:hypothetical protein HK099_007719 [Clydaea vesicula]KAJ3380394.1 hypothetical protein HDU92_006029 [Lobulomyces angularis]